MDRMKKLFTKDKNSSFGDLLRLFKEDQIGLALVGVVNIESGMISARTERFNQATQDYTAAFRECDNCSSEEENRLFFVNCKKCGKGEDNYFWIPSGDGDGIYAVFELNHVDESKGEAETHGFAIVLFPTEDFVEPIVEHVLKNASEVDSPLMAVSFSPGLLDPQSELEAFEVTRLKGSKDGEVVFFSDAMTTVDSNNVIFNMMLQNTDDITVLAFSEFYQAVYQGPKPRIIIGYSTNWLKEKGFKASKPRPSSQAVYDDWTMFGMANCHMNPMCNEAIWVNFKINEVMEKYNYAGSWLLQGALYGDADCLSEIDRYQEYTSDPEWVTTWLGQRMQFQAAIDHEEGRLTFPFSSSNSNAIKFDGKSTVPFEDKCTILGQFWYEFRDEEGDMSDFIKSQDVGLPLAWFISTGVVKSLELGEVLINETFQAFLDALHLEESEIVGLNSLDSLLEKIESRNQSD